MAVIFARDGYTVCAADALADVPSPRSGSREAAPFRSRTLYPKLVHTANGSSVDAGDDLLLADGIAEVTVSPSRVLPSTDSLGTADWLEKLEGREPDLDVLLIDGGPLRDCSAAVALAHVVDAIVLVVPLPYEDREELDALIRSSFGMSHAVLIPVLNHPPRPGTSSRGSRGSRHRTAVASYGR